MLLFGVPVWSDRRMELGAIVAELRGRAGLSQSQLSSATGLSIDAVRAIEQGRQKDVQASTALVLARALHTTVEVLLDASPEGRLIRASQSIAAARALGRPVPEDLLLEAQRAAVEACRARGLSEPPPTPLPPSIAPDPSQRSLARRDVARRKR